MTLTLTNWSLPYSSDSRIIWPPEMRASTPVTCVRLLIAVSTSARAVPLAKLSSSEPWTPLTSMVVEVLIAALGPSMRPRSALAVTSTVTPTNAPSGILAALTRTSSNALATMLLVW